MPSYDVTDPQTGRSVTLTGDSPPTEEELENIFASLPPVKKQTNNNSNVAAEPQDRFALEDIPENATGRRANVIKGRNSKVLAVKKRTEALEKLREVNPYLADEIENMNDFESALIGAGGAVQNLIDGVSRLAGTKTQEEVEKPHFEQLKEINSAAKLGEFLGEAGMMVGPGAVASAASKAGLRTAILAGAASGGAETGLISAGQGDDAEETLVKTAAGMAIGGAIPAAGAGIKRAMDYIKTRRATPFGGGPTKPTGTQLQTDVDLDAAKRNTANNAEEAVQEAVDPMKGPAPASAKKQHIKDKIAQGSADKDTAGFKINDKGELVKDKIEGKVLSQGWSEGITPVIKQSSRLDRQKMNSMVKVFKRGTENLKEKARTRPSDILGETIMNRYKAVKQLNKDAGKKIDSIALQDLKGQQVDFAPAIDKFKANLEQRGVRVNDDWTLDYFDSTIEFKPATKKLLNQTIEKMKRSNTEQGVDALRGHKTKRFIREQLDFGVGGTQDASSDIKNVLKELSSDIDGVLDNNFPRYKQVNEQYHDSITALDAWHTEAGGKFKPDQANVASFAGTVARSFLSNNRGRAALYSALDGLEGTARKYGKKFNDDVMNQVVFIEEMERFLGPSATTSLFGDVDKAVQRSGRAMTGGFREAVIDKAGSVAEKVFGKTQEKALDRMLEYLDSFAA